MPAKAYEFGDAADRDGSSLRLLIDLQVTQITAYAERGLPRYAANFADAVLTSGARVAGFTLNPALPAPGKLPESVRQSGLLVANTRATYRRLSAHGPLLTVFTCPFFEQHPVDAVLAHHVLMSGAPFAVLLYDVIPYVMPDSYQKTFSERSLYRVRHQLVRAAAMVFTISEHTRQDAIGVLGIEPSRVRVIGASTSSQFTRPAGLDDDRGLARALIPELGRDFVLGVGGPDSRKRWTDLIDAFALLPRPTRDGLQLVVVSHPTASRELRAQALRRGLSQHEFIVAPLVSDRVLRGLYQAARLFVLPSQYEGFGLPVLEAARCGCAAVTSDASSLPEVLRFAPATFPLGDIAAMADLITRVLTDQAFRERLQLVGAEAARKHTWGAVVQRFSAALPGIVATNRHRPRSRRIAVVGRSSGDGEIAAGLRRTVLERLARQCEVDCFRTSGPQEPHGGTSRAWRTFPMAALGRTFAPWNYDTVIYVVDRHNLSSPLRRLLSAHPGVMFVRVDPADVMSEVRVATGIVVPSIAAQRRLQELDYSMAAAAVLPLPAPPLAAPSPAVEPNEPTVIAPEALVESDQAERLVEALALLETEQPTRLVVLGRCSATVRRSLIRHAHEHGLAHEPVLPGVVGRDEYTQRLARASCAVELRDGWSAGGSYSLLDSLSVGTPVVTDRVDARLLETDGIVHVAPQASPRDLANSIAQVVDPHDMERRRQAAQNCAIAWQGEQFAEGLLTHITRIADSSRTPAESAQAI